MTNNMILDGEADHHIATAKRHATRMESEGTTLSLARLNTSIGRAETLLCLGNKHAMVAEPARIAGEIVALRQRYEAIAARA